MKILSIETSSEICSVAILENETVLKEIHLENGNTHSQNLMPLIEQILNETNLSLNDIDLFSCDNGPGSFTGIRIGISTLKAFRDITQKPIIGVSSLEVLAYNLNTNADYICSIIDAKNDNVYYGIFKNTNNTITKIHEFNFNNINKIIEYFKTETFLNKKIFFVGNGSIVYKNVIEFELNNNAEFADNTYNKLNAINVAKASFNIYNTNKSDFSNITPLYLKKSSAEITLEEKNESNNRTNES